MSWRESAMYPSVRRNLRAIYPKYQGWVIFVQPRWYGGKWSQYEVDLIAQRRTRHGFIERVIVEVKVTHKVTTKDVEQLNRYAKKLAGGRAKVVAKILVVPSGADILNVPRDIYVMFLKNFKCEKDGFCWYSV